MEAYRIRRVSGEELPECLAVIRGSFQTVAGDFGLTEENCPGHTSFMTPERLETHFTQGWQMYGMEWDGRLIGCYALSRADENRFELHNLAVLPEHRHCGCGKRMLEDAKARVLSQGGWAIAIGIIEESAVLKCWYMGNGFVSTGTQLFPHLPFTVGFLEWTAK